MKIAVFDSGVGGITVLKDAMLEMPNEDYLYYADTKNVPYGTKTHEEVRRFILEAVDSISGMDIAALVVACNTATSIAINDLRSKYSFPVIGMEPAVKPAVSGSRDKRILVTATPLTLKEQKFHSLIEKLESGNIVDPLPLPGLVELAEKFMFDEDSAITYLGSKLKEYDLTQYGALVLGCTHFIYFKSFFEKLLPPSCEIIDGNAGTIRQLKNILIGIPAFTPGRGSGYVEFFTSYGKQEPYKFQKYLEYLRGN